jgi:glycine/D-amino acid oxidase-like deaminating enzyme
MPDIPENTASAEVAVIGGGVIGMCIALRLAKEGREVMVIEPNQLGSGASYGNAGTIADYATLPVANPTVLRNLPSLLFDRDSPLSVRLAALPGLAPWIARFGLNCLPHRARANAATLGQLLADAPRLWSELAREVGAEGHLRQDGCLYLFESAKAFEGAGYDESMRRNHGVELQVLRPDQVAQLEPDLLPIKGGAHYFPNAVSIDDPAAVMAKLAAGLQAAGVGVIRDAVTSLERRGTMVHMRCSGCTLSAATAIIAAGAHSRRLAAQAGDPVPLDTERGYHIEYEMKDLPLRRVVASVTRGFYAVPMAGRLRIAGTVELGGLTLPPDRRRFETLQRGANALLPHLGTPHREWFGFRPSMPDSIPVIRASRRGTNVILAFGHGHIGLTLAPATARVVAGIMSGGQ